MARAGTVDRHARLPPGGGTPRRTGARARPPWDPTAPRRPAARGRGDGVGRRPAPRARRGPGPPPRPAHTPRRRRRASPSPEGAAWSRSSCRSLEPEVAPAALIADHRRDLERAELVLLAGPSVEVQAFARRRVPNQSG